MSTNFERVDFDTEDLGAGKTGLEERQRGAAAQEGAREAKGLSYAEARSAAAHATKRCLDILGAGVSLVVLAPVLLIAALFIKVTSPGPVVFRQRRIGLHGKPFEILKFRTMDATRGDLSGVTQTREGDPRVTSVGRFLRKTNIDELPQLINVLKGNMSLVGPRPHVPDMLAGGIRYDLLVPEYGRRHCMRPGITGLAQASGLRGPTSDARFARARIEYDIVYVDDWSLLLDLRILWTTIKNECLRGTGT